MSNIIEFPKKDVSDKAFLEKEVESILSDKGASEETINFAKERAKYWFDFGKDDGIFSFAIELGSINADEAEAVKSQIQLGVDNLCEQYQAMISKLKSQLILKEIRIFQLESQNE